MGHHDGLMCIAGGEAPSEIGTMRMPPLALGGVLPVRFAFSKLPVTGSFLEQELAISSMNH